jgi:sterol-4alpha-carboxylate 3-dehydrogenase (decarboxylating)
LYDLIYAPVHAAAHLNLTLYSLIHKHHHRQVSPFRGVDDAINTHPIEYGFGMWLHIFVARILAYTGLPMHPCTLLVFIGVGAILAAANHTRVEVYFPFLFNSNEHDTHHRFSRYNYAQYTQAWDRLIGTFREWTAPPILPPRVGPAAAITLSPKALSALHDAPKVCVVTGGNGLVGARLCTMLIERGATRVTSIDITPPPPSSTAVAADSRLRSITADVCDIAALTAAFQGADVVFHVAALVGPGFKVSEYERVNVEGTRAVLEAVRAAHVRALVFTSSPTTRLDGADEHGTAICDRARVPSNRQLQEYSKTKAKGEELALAASCTAFPVCAIAPHQVYGPSDRLFLPALLRAAASGRLRVFGLGDNLISWTHVDNAAHAHILAAAALLRGDKGIAGEFFVVTDTGAGFLWDCINSAVIACDLPSLETRLHAPIIALTFAAHAAALFSSIFLKKPLPLAPFAVRMLTINRYFDVSKLQTRLGYSPLVSFDQAWPQATAAVRARLIDEGILPPLVIGEKTKNL